MRQITILSLLVCFTFPAAAQENSPYKGGLKYTTKAAPMPAEDTQIKKRVFAKPTEDLNTEEKAAEKAWEYYKSLAAGTAGETEKPNEAPVRQPSKPQPPEVQRPAGFAGILQDYKKQKETRGTMRTMRMEKQDLKSSKTDAGPPRP